MALDKKDNVAFVNSLLVEASSNRIAMSHIKLQKLLYLCYGHFAASHDGEKIADVSFEAWQYGPVIPNVYHEFKHFGDKIINRQCVFSGDNLAYTFSDKNSNRNKAIAFVINSYGSLPSSALIDITHRDDGAWRKAYIEQSGTEIAHEEILKEFKVHVA